MPAPLTLCYHALGEFSREQDPGHMHVPPARFHDEISSLKRRGYEFVTVSEFASRLRASGPPHGTCAISFDDGSLDNLVLLPAMLADLGVPATVYACPGLLGQPHPFVPAETGVRLMNADELRELASNELIEIGSHTSAHTELTRASAEVAYEEMARSKQELEAVLEAPVHSFAYPYCGFSEACPAAAERAGYTSAVTCGLLGGWRPFAMQRELVDALDGRFSFALKSRLIWRRIYDAPPGRAARRLARARRHPASASGNDP